MKRFLILPDQFQLTITLKEGNYVMNTYPQLHHRLHRYYPMQQGWTKPPKRRWFAKSLATWSLIGMLVGCTHTPSSVIPQDGLTMQTIYQRASHSASSPLPKKATHAVSPPSHPTTAPLFIAPHTVTMAGERILIPGYTVHFHL